MVRVPHNRPSLGAREAAAAQRILAGAFLARGRETALFEDDVCAYLGLDSGHAVAVSSGTAALYLALCALGAQGKPVGVQRYTCAAVGHAVRLAGGRKVPVDTVSGAHADLDLRALSDSGVQIAVVAHNFGIPQDLRNLPMPVIEDCAQALGATIDGKPVGLQGDAGIFSFYATKMITSGGQGGMVVSKDKRFVQTIREMLAYNLPGTPKMNFEITDLGSAVGRVQLKRLDELRTARERIFAQYVAAGIPLMTVRDPRAMAVRYRAVVVDDNVREIARALDARGIDTRTPIMPEELEDAPPGTNADALSRRSLFIPIFPDLDERDVKHVIGAVSGEMSATP